MIFRARGGSAGIRASSCLHCISQRYSPSSDWAVSNLETIHLAVAEQVKSLGSVNLKLRGASSSDSGLSR
jgi:hypothetical protein